MCRVVHMSTDASTRIAKVEAMAAAATNAEIRHYIDIAGQRSTAMDITDADREKAKIVLSVYRAELDSRKAGYAARAAEIAAERREQAMIQPTATATATAASTDTRPATAAQISYLRTLIAAEPASCFGFTSVERMTRSAASAAITALKSEV